METREERRGTTGWTAHMFRYSTGCTTNDDNCLTTDTPISPDQRKNLANFLHKNKLALAAPLRILKDLHSSRWAASQSLGKVRRLNKQLKFCLPSNIEQ